MTAAIVALAVYFGALVLLLASMIALAWNGIDPWSGHGR